MDPTSNKRKGWSRDGAVTCGLLAAECALKATLLKGHTANAPEQLPINIKDGLFDSSEGHKILLLWDRQAAGVKSLAPDSLLQAIRHLHLPDRYQLRYGGRRINEPEAKPFVDSSQLIIDWMMKVVFK